MNKALAIFGIIALAILIGVFGYLYGKSKFEGVQPDEEPTNISAAGDTYATPKISQIGLTNATNTIGSLYNGDARDRVLTGFYGYFENIDDVTSTPMQLNVATSAEATGHAANTNYAFSTWVCETGAGDHGIACGISTSSDRVLFSSSTSGRANWYQQGWEMIWKAGTYLNWLMRPTTTSNGQPTSTLSGVVGVEYYNQ